LTFQLQTASPTDPSSLEARQSLVFQSQRIRGTCALAIVLIHVTSPPDGTPVGWLTAAAVLVSNSLARFAVPCFMVLSAFYLSLNPRNERPLPFYRRTLTQLAIPYVLYSTIYVLYTHRQAAGLPRRWLSAIVTGTAYVHLWFIPVIVMFYVLHPFLRKWFRRTRRGGRWVVAAFAFQLAWAVATSNINAASSTTSWFAPAKVLRAFLCYLGYSLAGYYLHDHAGRLLALTRRLPLVIGATLAWLTIAVFIAVARGPDRQFATFPPVGKALEPLLCVAAFVVLAVWRSGSPLTRPLERLVDTCGLYAYGVYYLHMLVLGCFTWTCARFVDSPTLHGLFYLLAFPTVSILSVLTVKLLARLPFGRYFA